MTRTSTRSTPRCFRELLTYMMEDPRNIGVCAHLLFCAKNIERMGDHATNVAENVYYLVTGTKLLVERVKAAHYEPGEAIGRGLMRAGHRRSDGGAQHETQGHDCRGR